MYVCISVGSRTKCSKECFAGAFSYAFAVGQNCSVLPFFFFAVYALHFFLMYLNGFDGVRRRYSPNLQCSSVSLSGIFEMECLSLKKDNHIVSFKSLVYRRERSRGRSETLSKPLLVISESDCVSMSKKGIPKFHSFQKV